MKLIIEEAEEMLERVVKCYKTSTRISVPKTWANRRIKIILVKDE